MWAVPSTNTPLRLRRRGVPIEYANLSTTLSIVPFTAGDAHPEMRAHRKGERHCLCLRKRRRSPEGEFDRLSLPLPKREETSELELFHEQVPLPVPCYDLLPVTEFTFGPPEWDFGHSRLP